MRRVNLLAPEFDGSRDRESYRWRSAAIGKQLGAEKIGASLYELGEGERELPVPLPPRHGGVAARRRRARRRCAARTASASCGAATSSASRRARRRAPGSRAGHGADAVGAAASLETIEYPDSGKVGVEPAAEDLPLADAVDYWEGE